MAKEKYPEEELTEIEEIVTDTQETEDEIEQSEMPEDTVLNKKAKAAYKKMSAEDCEALNDRFIRLAAEYDNFRKRSARERENVHADAVSHAIMTLLPTYDNLERALKQPTDDVEYKKGVELTFKQLTEAFASLHVTPIEDTSETLFDPNLHNAVMHVEDEALGEGVIAEVFQRGFRLGDKVIRHSMVKVAN